MFFKKITFFLFILIIVFSSCGFCIQNEDINENDRKILNRTKEILSRNWNPSAYNQINFNPIRKNDVIFNIGEYYPNSNAYTFPNKRITPTQTSYEGDNIIYGHYQHTATTPTQHGNFPTGNFQQNTFGIPNNFFGIQFRKAIEDITKNDDLNCIPRLLCQITGYSNRRSEFLNFLKIPPITGLISVLPGSSPMGVFAKAAAIGFTGGKSTCYDTYSKCPKNEDDLLFYLNNHKGGFFKFFNGEAAYHDNNQNSIYPGQHINDIQTTHNQNQNEYGGSHNSNFFENLSSLLPQEGVVATVSNLLSNLYTVMSNYQRNSNQITRRNIREENNKKSHVDCQLYPKHNSCSKYKIFNNYNSQNKTKKPEDKEIEGRITNKFTYSNSDYVPKVTFPDKLLSVIPTVETQRLRASNCGEKCIKFEKNENLLENSQTIFPYRTGTGNLRFDTGSFKNLGKIVNRPNRYNYYYQHTTESQIQNFRPTIPSNPGYYNQNRYPSNKYDDQNVYVTNSRGDVEYYIKPNGMKVYL